MIGLRILFFRPEWNPEGGIKKWHAFDGIILDKVLIYEKIGTKFVQSHEYLVKLQGGIIDRFKPEEAAQVLPEFPCPGWAGPPTAPNQRFIEQYNLPRP